MKLLLTKITIGLSFVTGASVIALGGILAFIGGCALHFLGYWLMDKLKEMN